MTPLSGSRSRALRSRRWRAVPGLLVIAIVGCGGATPPPATPTPVAAPAPAPPPVTERATAPIPPPPRAPLTREEELVLEHGAVRRFGLTEPVAESQFWDPCVRRFVGAQPEAVRRVLTTAFARYATACDREGRVVLQLTRGIDGRERRGKSDVGFVGSFSTRRIGPEGAPEEPRARSARIDLSLRVAYCGQPAPIADHIVIASDDARWSSNRIDFERDEHGCEVAELPVTRALARVLRAAIDATDTLVRFEGRRAEDLVVGDDMKQDLRVMLDALDALES